MKLRLSAAGLLAGILLVPISIQTLVAAPIAPKVTATEDALVLRLDFPVPTLEAGERGVEPKLAGLPSYSAEPGHPRLPLARFTVVLPPGKDVRGVEVTGTSGRMAGTHRFAWGQKPRPIGSPPVFDTPADPEIYESDQPYPAVPAWIEGGGFFRGYHVVSVAVHPVQVQPLSGYAVAWSGMTVRLNLETTGAAAAMPPRGLASDLNALASLAVNPEAGYSYGAPQSSSFAEKPYMIVTTEAFAPYFQRLLDHRAESGMAGDIVTMEWVEANHTGVDRAEKLRNAIAEAYQNHGTTFVLLGGDDEADDGTLLIPTRHCAQSDNTPSDYYFGALDGNWNDDGDGQYCEAGEIDYYTEVHIGRATVDTPAEIDGWIDKVLAYESGLNEDRRTDLVWIGESLDSSTWGGDSKDVTADLIPQDEFIFEYLYERIGTFNKSNVIQSLNRGPHLVNHLGHSNESYVMGLNISDVEGLVNETPFFSYSQGCYAGAFDQGVSGNTEAISEHFLTTQHAAFAVVMNGRYGWYSPGSVWGPSQYFDHEFYDAMFTEGLRTLGEANDDSRMDNAGSAQSNSTMRYCFLETNLHGDPATPVQIKGAMVRYLSHRIVDEEPEYGNCNGFAEPGETVQIGVTLQNHDYYDDATDVSAVLTSATPGVTVHDGWAGWADLAPQQSAENSTHHFTASFDVSCGDRATFQLEIRYDGGKSGISVFEFILGDEHEWDVLVDDFESDLGWTAGGTAVTGAFERADPHGVSSSGAGAVQPEDDATEGGTICWVTYNPETGSGFVPGDGDVDRGTVYLESPVFDGTGEGALLLNFSRWFHRSAVGPLDHGHYEASVSNDGGSNWTVLEHLETSATSWVTRAIDLASVIQPTNDMMLHFEARETRRVDGDPLVELLVDDVRLYRYAVYCDGFYPDETLPPNPVGDSLLVERSGDDVVLHWTAPAEDPEHDAARFYPVHRSESPTGGFGQVGDPTECCMHDVNSESPVGVVLYYVVSSRNEAGTSGEEPSP
jgi:hypothetical protein